MNTEAAVKKRFFCSSFQGGKFDLNLKVVIWDDVCIFSLVVVIARCNYQLLQNNKGCWS